jgi:inosose dehydratase
MRHLSNAPVSWGVFTAETAPLSAERYLDEVAAAGYRGTELGPYGFLPTDPARLGAALEARGLSLDGAVHVHDFTGPDAALNAAVAQTGALLTACGARHFIVMGGGQAHAPRGHAPEAWRRILATLESAAACAADLGLTLSVHPHVLTMVERPEEVERLLSDSDLALCFDTGHHAFWGDDATAFFRAHAARVAYVHLKNVNAALTAEVQAGRLDTRAALDRGAFCPLDAGTVDIPGFLAALDAAGFAGPVVVEQDWSAAARQSPATLAARNAEYLAGAMA